MERYTGPKSRQEILAEIEGWKRDAPKGHFTWHAELNNFHAYLPCDDYIDKGGRQKWLMASAAGLMDVKNSESHRGTPQILYYSNLYLSQTQREFFEEIDRTIESTPGVFLAEIKKFSHAHYLVSDIFLRQKMLPEEEERELKKIEKSMKILKKLYEYALPAYIELRVKGYSHFDLTG